MSYFKIGFRYLARRKFRTILTVTAILLGVSILMGTSVATDSIRYSLNYQVSKQFGYTDILLMDQAAPNSNAIPLDLIREELETITNIQFEWTYQMREYRSATPLKNTPTTMARWWKFVGINASDPIEPNFGRVEINSTINEALNSLEEMLSYPAVTNSCVITQYIAESYNLSVGQSIYVYPEVPWAGIDWVNSNTWVNLTITGIIEDKGKSFEWLSPPITDLWEIMPPQQAIYVDITVARQYIFNQDPNDVNLVLIHASSLQMIETTIEEILETLASSSDFQINSTNFYGFNVKSFFDEQISGMFNFFTTILALFAGISLLVCAILIKNLFEIAKEEQMEEVGIMRAIGISKGGIFRIYFTQIAIISVFGSFLGVFFGYFVSFLFLGPLKVISFSLDPNLSLIVSSDFRIFIDVTPFAIFFSLTLGICVSVVFGTLPAISAANVEVLKALNPRLREGE